MNLNNLTKIITKSKKRLGRGHGSGKVKTAGRGTKGQKSRGKIKSDFEGGQLPIIKRLPLLRGKTRNRSRAAYTYAFSIEKLAKLPAGTTVSLETLRKYHMIDRSVAKVKILGGGTLPVSLTVAIACSKSAKASIEKAGGKVVEQ